MSNLELQIAAALHAKKAGAKAMEAVGHAVEDALSFAMAEQEVWRSMRDSECRCGAKDWRYLGCTPLDGNCVWYFECGECGHINHMDTDKFGKDVVIDPWKQYGPEKHGGLTSCALAAGGGG